MKTSLNILYVGNSGRQVSSVLEGENFTVSIVSNGVEAVNFLHSNLQPDALVCEYHLTGQNGLFLYDWVRARGLYVNMPFILASEAFNAEVFKVAFIKGVDDYYLLKDIQAAGFRERIHFLKEFRKNTLAEGAVAYGSAGYKMPVSKRIFDVVVAGIALLLASPILLLAIIAIRLESRGKVYYTSKRVGRKTFDFYKLRSMYTGSDHLLKKLAKEKNQYNKTAVETNKPKPAACPRCSKLPAGQTCSPLLYIDNNQVCDYWYNFQKNDLSKSSSAFVKIADDPRITRVGKFIRNTSIDELPQLINVIKGDMSIVGNRPLPVYEAELLTVDALSKRFLAPAGITGLWQVELRGKGGDMSEQERKELDNEYARHFEGNNFSLWYDLRLILRTVPALLQKGSV